MFARIFYVSFYVRLKKLVAKPTSLPHRFRAKNTVPPDSNTDIIKFCNLLKTYRHLRFLLDEEI